jgi:hypothetical protein
MSTTTKIIDAENIDLLTARYLNDELRPEQRGLGRSYPLAQILALVALHERRDQLDTRDPRPSVISAEVAQYGRKLLENAGVDVDASVDRALGVTA